MSKFGRVSFQEGTVLKRSSPLYFNNFNVNLMANFELFLKTSSIVSQYLPYLLHITYYALLKFCTNDQKSCMCPARRPARDTLKHWQCGYVYEQFKSLIQSNSLPLYQQMGIVVNFYWLDQYVIIKL